MRIKPSKLVLTASLALAMAFTISCSSDKDDGDKSSSSTDSGGSVYCEINTSSSFKYCLAMPSEECSASFAAYSGTMWQGLTYKKVNKCETEPPDIVCFKVNTCTFVETTTNMKSYCENVLDGTAFNTIKECLDYVPPAPTGPLCRLGNWCGPVASTLSCTDPGGTIVESCD